MSVLTAIFGVAIFGVLVVVFLPGIVDDISFESDCCSICESYWAYSELEDGEVVIDDCGGTHIALRELWDDYNNGKGKTRTQKHIDFLETMRIKNNGNYHSFDLINLSNPCPSSPNLKYLGTGFITEYIPCSYDGPAYSITRMKLNGSNWTFSNCGWHPYPYNNSNLTHAFREKGNTWFNRCKHAELYDANVYPNLPDNINESWVEWDLKYQTYLDNGGVDVGSQF